MLPALFLYPRASFGTSRKTSPKRVSEMYCRRFLRETRNGTRRCRSDTECRSRCLNDLYVLHRIDDHPTDRGFCCDGLFAVRAFAGRDADACRHGLFAVRASAQLNLGLVRRCRAWSEAHDKPPLFLFYTSAFASYDRPSVDSFAVASRNLPHDDITAIWPSTCHIWTRTQPSSAQRRPQATPVFCLSSTLYAKTAVSRQLFSPNLTSLRFAPYLTRYRARRARRASKIRKRTSTPVHHQPSRYAFISSMCSLQSFQPSQ